MLRIAGGALRCVRGTRALFRDRHGCSSSRLVSPELCYPHPPLSKGRREGRAPAGTRSPACANEARTGWTTGVPQRPAFPARMVLTVSFALSSGSDALLPPSPCGWLMRGPGWVATSPQALTHRPRASGPHDFSVRAHPHPHSRRLACARHRDQTRTLSAPCRTAPAAAHGITALQPVLRADAVAATASQPASRDGRETPLVAGRDVSGCTVKTELL
ncbi:hypothetical protein ACVIIV_006466 [Bradyrhizobium sp. USDA 4354]